MKIMVELTDEQIEFWQRRGITMGYLRSEPQKRWSEKNKKEAIRFAIIQTAERCIVARKSPESSR